MTAMASLEDLKDIYNAENQAIKAYPKLLDSVTRPELKEAMQLNTGGKRYQSGGGEGIRKKG